MINETPTALLHLPTEVLQQILSYLPVRDLYHNVEVTCRELRSATYSVYRSKYGGGPAPISKVVDKWKLFAIRNEKFLKHTDDARDRAIDYFLCYFDDPNDKLMESTEDIIYYLHENPQQHHRGIEAIIAAFNVRHRFGESWRIVGGYADLLTPDSKALLQARINLELDVLWDDCAVKVLNRCLLSAVSTGNRSLFITLKELIIAKYGDVNYLKASVNASRSGMLEMLQYLQTTSDINSNATHKDELLETAMINDRAHIVKLLLDTGHFINLQSHYKLALRCGYVNVLHQFLEYSPNVLTGTYFDDGELQVTFVLRKGENMDETIECNANSKLEAIGEKAHQVEPDKEKQTVESNTLSTMASSSVNGVDDGPATEEKAVGEPPEPVMEYPKGIEVLFIMAALMLSITLCSLDQTIVATAIPKITDQFHSLDDISWYGSAYFMTLGAFQSTWGKAFKYFPLKTSFLVAIFIFEVGSLIAAVAPNSMTLIVGRAISGLGASGIAPGVYTISAFAAEPTKRATYTGVIGVSYGVAAVCGPLIGGGLTKWASWRWCFYINLPIGGLAAFVILLTFKAPKAAKVAQATLKEKLLHMDPIATVLTMGALTCLLLALQYGGVTHAWDSSVVIGLLVGFVVIVIALIIAEIWQGERAMLTPRIVCKRTVWVSSVWGFFFAGAFIVTLYYLPIYFQSIDNVSPIGSGVRNIPLIIMFSIATYGSARAITKTGIATPYMAAASVIVTIASGLLYTLDIGTSTGKWVGYQILAGFGYGLALQVPVVVAQAFAAPSDIAPTTAIIIFARSVGGTILLAAAQSGFVNQIVHKLANTAPSVNPALVTGTGATDVHRLFSGAELDSVVRAYAWGIKVVFALTIAACGLTVPFSLCNKWANVNAKIPSGGSA